MAYDYDIALSFAGEDRNYVREVACLLKDLEVRVFYDEFEEENLWGKNLYSYLSEIYSRKSRYTIIFCSKFYAEKLWTNHERESAQERAFNENKEYILPAVFDDTKIPGILKTTGYIDLRKVSPSDFCRKILKKLDISDDEHVKNSTNNYATNVEKNISFVLTKIEEYKKNSEKGQAQARRKIDGELRKIASTVSVIFLREIILHSPEDPYILDYQVFPLISLLASNLNKKHTPCRIKKALPPAFPSLVHSYAYWKGQAEKTL